MHPTLSFLDETCAARLFPLLETVSWPENTRIFTAGDEPEGCYFLQTGTVRLEVFHPDHRAEVVLGHVDAGSVLGEIGLLSGQARGATAIAQTPVTALHLSTTVFRCLFSLDPELAGMLVRGMVGAMAARQQSNNSRFLQQMSIPFVEVERLVSDARDAQRALCARTEAEVDALLADIVQALDQDAAVLAELAVEETGMGRVEHKTEKNRLACQGTWADLQAQRGTGVLQSDHAVYEVAAPIGVIVALVPVTNPVAAAIFKILVCLKARSAIILSPHRAGVRCGAAVVDRVEAVLRAHNLPTALVQVVRNRSSRTFTEQLMRHSGVGMVLATGGPSMVRAAYSSGTPALGVGAGNAPCWIAADADLERAVQDIIQSKSFDNGIICASEHNLVAEAPIRERLIHALEAAGAAVLTTAERRRATATWLTEGHFRQDLLGRDAAVLAAVAGVRRPRPIRLLVVPAETTEVDSWLGREKLAPVVSLFSAQGPEEALVLCQLLLERQGAGHTAVIHSQDPARVRRFAEGVPAGRLLVNTPAVQGMLGITTGLQLSFMLGCGTFGGNSTTDPVGLRHLLNIKRLAFDDRMAGRHLSTEPPIAMVS